MSNTRQLTRLWSLLTHPLTHVVALALLAATVAFYRLGDGTLCGDEAAFAFTTERMHATGDWIVPYIGDAPHLNATPLYNWLTLPLVHCFGEAPFWHRCWSALFGVGCVLLTYWLGKLLFRAEVGFLAGVFLALNRDFFCAHGVRFGGMDAMTAFFLTGAVVAYVSQSVQPCRAWPAWTFVGLSIGLAWLSKPPVFGLFFFAMIVAHHAWTRRKATWRDVLRGPLLAIAIAAAVAGPWYLLMGLRLGGAGLYQLFVFNSVVRGVQSSPASICHVHKAFWHASNSFKLLELAFIAAAVCFGLQHNRTRWGLLLFVTGGYLAALTVAGKVNANYTYYAYPLLCVLVAAYLLEAAPWLVNQLLHWPVSHRRTLRAAVAVACIIVAADVSLIASNLAAPKWVHPPLQVYAEVLPALEKQQCRFIMYDFAHARRTASQPAASTNFEELYYGPRMQHVEWVDSVEQLRARLADAQPTIVVLPPLGMPTPAMAEICNLSPDERVDLGLWPQWTYPVLSFHDAAAHSYPARLGDQWSKHITASFSASRSPANRESR